MCASRRVDVDVADVGRSAPALSIPSVCLCGLSLHACQEPSRCPVFPTSSSDARRILPPPSSSSPPSLKIPRRASAGSLGRRETKRSVDVPERCGVDVSSFE